MKPHSPGSIVRPRIILAALALIVLIGWMLWPKAQPPAVDNTASEPSPRGDTMAETPPPGPKEEPKTEEVVPNFPDFQVRPFAVVKETSANQWTAEDGKDPNVVRRLAHNPMEEARLLRDNERLLRRQLVYRVESLIGFARQIRNGTEPLDSFRIPSFDGTEFEVELDQTEFVNGGAEGDFIGHIKGEPESTVVLSFVGGTEIFSVRRPGMNAVEGEPREPGQVMLKEYDPNAPPFTIDEGGVPPLKPAAKD